MTTTDTEELQHDEPTEWLPMAGSCPAWCDRGHNQASAEGNGWYESQERQGKTHEVVLQEHRNPADHRVTSSGGGGWCIYPRVRPRGPFGGYMDEPTIRLELSEGPTDALLRQSAEVLLTSGGVRVLARQLLDLADLLDLQLQVT